MQSAVVSSPLAKSNGTTIVSPAMLQLEEESVTVWVGRLMSGTNSSVYEMWKCHLLVGRLSNSSLGLQTARDELLLLLQLLLFKCCLAKLELQERSVIKKL